MAMILSVVNLLLIIWSHLPSTSCGEWSFGWTNFSHLRNHNRCTDSGIRIWSRLLQPALFRLLGFRSLLGSCQTQFLVIDCLGRDRRATILLLEPRFQIWFICLALQLMRICGRVPVSRQVELPLSVRVIRDVFPELA